ncbi:MAG: acyl-CoA thioesterase [Rhizobiaceae bacterium]|nr:acyl-CoA thioesterase [Rhizobiaceae bacterium]
MNLILRMIMVFAAAFLGRKTHFDDVHRLRFTVLPNDLDTNLHMNNGRYLTLMDLGRVDMMIRSGLIRAIMSEKWMPVIAGVSMIYRRSLNPFERYTLETRVLGWDDRWAYLEQTFINAKGELSARGFVKAAFLQAGKRLDMDVVVRAGGAAGPSPMLDDALLALFPKAA